MIDLNRIRGRIRCIYGELRVKLFDVKIEELIVSVYERRRLEKLLSKRAWLSGFSSRLQRLGEVS